MSAMELLSSPYALVAVAVAGGTGSALRFLLDRAVSRVQVRRQTSQASAESRTAAPHVSPAPLGIFTVNVLACLAIGLVAGLSLHWVPAVFAGLNLDAISLIVGAALIGGFSTLSTVAVDTVRLLTARRVAWALANTLGMFAVSTAFAWIGYTLCSAA